MIIGGGSLLVEMGFRIDLMEASWEFAKDFEEGESTIEMK